MRTRWTSRTLVARRRPFPCGLREPFTHRSWNRRRRVFIDAVESLKFKDPSIPIVANCTAKPVTKGEDVKRELIAGICNCVHWSRSVDYMMGSGVNRFIEVGPGRVLSGMVKRINRRADVQAVGDWDSIVKLSRN